MPEKRPVRHLVRPSAARTSVKVWSTNGTTEVDIDNREPIVDHMLHRYGDHGEGQLEGLSRDVDHLRKVLRAVLMGCSKKDFRHTVQHAGLTVTSA